MKLQEIVSNRCGKEISQCTNEELYYALLEMTKGMAKEKESNQGKRKLYYISAEFLIGKLLSNNLINLGIYEDVKKLLADNGKSLAEIEEVEPEPSLGLSLIHISEPTRRTPISYAVFCLKKKKTKSQTTYTHLTIKKTKINNL